MACGRNEAAVVEADTLESHCVPNLGEQIEHHEEGMPSQGKQYIFQMLPALRLCIETSLLLHFY